MYLPSLLYLCSISCCFPMGSKHCSGHMYSCGAKSLLVSPALICASLCDWAWPLFTHVSQNLHFTEFQSFFRGMELPGGRPLPQWTGEHCKDEGNLPCYKETHMHTSTKSEDQTTIHLSSYIFMHNGICTLNVLLQPAPKMQCFNIPSPPSFHHSAMRRMTSNGFPAFPSAPAQHIHPRERC